LIIVVALGTIINAEIVDHVTTVSYSMDLNKILILPCQRNLRTVVFRHNQRWVL